jgi:hypothetical protein
LEAHIAEMLSISNISEAQKHESSDAEDAGELRLQDRVARRTARRETQNTQNRCRLQDRMTKQVPEIEIRSTEQTPNS